MTPGMPVGAAPAAAGVDAFYDLVDGSDSRAIAAVGLVKNAGKTTVVNALMANCRRPLGLTSLGLDGERTDHLTGLAKPSIAPPRGTLVATTQGSLDRSRYRLDILEELPFRTPLGRVIIGVAGGDGAVEVSGPTTLADLRATVERLLAHGAGRVLVDGAINRLGSASPRVSDGLIVATGGMAGDDLDDIVATTVAALDLLTLPSVGDEWRRLAEPYAGASRSVLFTADGEAHTLEQASVLGEGAALARAVERLGAETLLLSGAATHDFVDDFSRVLRPGTALRLIIRDPTVLVAPPASVARLRRAGVRLEVLAPLRVLALTVNPFRVPQPYRPEVFFSAIATAVGDRLPVFDVVNGLAHLPVDADGVRSVPPRKLVTP